MGNNLASNIGSADRHWIAIMLQQQFDMASVTEQTHVKDLLVADAFALGYAFGFADHACTHFMRKGGTDARNAYVQKSIADLIGDEVIGDTLVSYAQLQLKEPVFLRGYRSASRNMKDWLKNAGGTTPIDLADHLDRARCA